MIIHGACHCGSIGFTLQWEPDPQRIEARCCGCSFCTAHGAAWTSNPQGILAVTIDVAASLSSYRFGTQTADFQVCSRCGVVPLVTSRIDGQLYAVVNVNTFDAAARALLHTKPAVFDEESEPARLARRQRNWIADVRFAAQQIV